MNPVKISYSSSILYDTYGNPNGQPILVLEDFFLKNVGSYPPLENIFFREYAIYHFKRLEWENFPFLEKSLLQDIQNRLEEILLFREEKWILISQGYSAGLALHLALQETNRIHELHLLSPILLLPSQTESLANYSDFWNWWTSGKDPIFYFYQLPFLAEFFGKYLRFLELCCKQNYEPLLHFWFTEQTTQKESIQIQMQFPRSEINRVDKTQSKTMLHERKIQKILAWKISKKWVP